MMKNSKEMNAPKHAVNAFIGKTGGVRTGWLLAIALIAFYGIRLAIRIGLNAGFASLFEAWGVNASTVFRAPQWAQMLFVWHGSIITVIISLCMLAVSIGIRKAWLKKQLCAGKASMGGRLLLIGVAFSVITAAFFLAIDSMRLEWPLSRPNLSLAQPILLLILMLSAISEEAFSKKVLFDGAQKGWGIAAAIAVSTAVFFLDSAGYAGNALSAVNVLLMGILCCCIYLKYGMLASAGFRCGCSFGASILMGFGSSAADSVYRVYHVSDGWFTGGAGGPVYGLWQTIILIAALMVINRNTLKSVFERMHVKKA